MLVNQDRSIQVVRSVGRWLERAADPWLTPRLTTLRRQRDRLEQPLRRGTSIAILGMEPKAGRTTVAWAFAELLAEHGPTRVLAVDTDTRGPGLRERLGAGSGGSWHGVLAGFRLEPPGTIPLPPGPVGFHWTRRHLTQTSGADLVATAPEEAGRSLTAHQYAAAITRLGRWYRAIVTDTPVWPSAPALPGVVNRADRIVIVGTADSRGAYGVLECLRQVNAIRSVTAAGLARCVLIGTADGKQLNPHIVRSVLKLPVHFVPHDESITASQPRWSALRDRTQRSFLELVTSTIAGLEHDAEVNFRGMDAAGARQLV